MVWKELVSLMTCLPYVRYVLPGSDAAAKNITRGDLFLSINNEQLTIDNYRDLLSSEVENHLRFSLLKSVGKRSCQQVSVSIWLKQKSKKTQSICSQDH